MEAHRFFRHLYLQSGRDYQRIFQVITDELSFIHDYYYSSLPFFFLNKLAGAMLTAISCSSILYSLFVFVLVSQALSRLGGSTFGQIECLVWCPGRATEQNRDRELTFIGFGNTCYDVIPIYFLILVVVVSEARSLAAYSFSNWAKVFRICLYVNKFAMGIRTNAPENFRTWTWNPVSSNWKDKLDQCSVLVQRPRWKVSHLFWHLLGLPDQKSVKDLSAVKNTVFKALTEGHLIIERDEEKGALKLIRLPLSPILSPNTAIPVNAFSECNGKGVADTILAWQIATGMFEMKHPQPLDLDPEGHRPAATQLSRYCVYLVAYYPELLPPEDDDDWCRKLYEDVKKDANVILRALQSPNFEQPADDSNREVHEVVTNGVMLAQKLLLVDWNTGWEALARFWSEMILYIAPSDNLDGHADAIARGGEFVTLLTHAGIAGRVDVPDGTSAAGDQVP